MFAGWKFGFARCAFIAILLAAVLPASAVEITDAAGRKVQVPAAITKVAAAGPPAQVLLYAFAPDTMVGWGTRLSPAAAKYIAEPYRNLPVIGMVTMGGAEPNAAGIVAAKPDLILDYGNVEPRYIALADKVQASTRIPYILVDGSFDKIPDTFRLLGRLLGRQQRAEELAGYMDDMKVRLGLVAKAHKPVKAYIVRGADGTFTTAPGGVYGGVYDMAGLRNVSNKEDATVAEISKWDPDVIISIDSGFLTTLGNAPWNDLRAVRERRVYSPPSLPWGWTDRPPSVSRVIGPLWLASAVYGDPNPQQLRAEVGRFFDLFYHVKLSPQQIEAVLAGS